MSRDSSHILWYSEIDEHDKHAVGQENIKRSEMIAKGITLPEGLVITASAYFLFLHQNKLIHKITQLLETVNYDLPESLEQVARHIQKLISDTPFSEEFVKEIDQAYTKLCGMLHTDAVSLSSSVTTEDLFTPTLVGELHTVVEVIGETNVLLQIKEIWASLFTPVAMLHRHEKKIDHFRVGMAMSMQRVIKTKKKGTMFTFDPIAGEKNIITIEMDKASYHLTKKSHDIIYQQAAKHALTEKELIALCKLGEQVEAYTFFPQKILWAIEKNTCYLISTKPAMQSLHKSVQTPSLTEKLRLLLKGTPVIGGIVSGKAIVLTEKNKGTIQHGDIVILSQLTPQLFPAIKKAAGFVTEKGNRSSHEALLARELGIPAIIGATGACSILEKQSLITLDGTQGAIYKGAFHTHKEIPPTATKLFGLIEELSEQEAIDETVIDGLLIQPTIMPELSSLALAKQLALCCKQLAPRSVMYCFSDNQNNLVGFHGAYRLVHQQEDFKKELEAIQRAKTEMHCSNLSVLVPFVRTVKELHEVLQFMQRQRIERGPHQKVFLQVAVPSNVILVEQFIEAGIDGLVIDVDTLTTLLLGTDKDDSQIANTFDPTNEAVLWAIEQTITVAHRYRLPVIITGDKAELSNSLLEKCIAWGITTVAINSQAVEKTRTLIQATEKELVERKSA